jgi:hypothetical protein
VLHMSLTGKSLVSSVRRCTSGSAFQAR